MKETTTKQLAEILNKIDKSDDLKEYLSSEKMIRDDMNFSQYYESLLKQKNVEVSDAVKNSGIERTYAYQIINGTRNNPSKDKILRLCIGIDCDLDATVRALEIAQAGPLYPRDKRDAIIIFAINNHCSVMDTNLLLNEFNEDYLA